MMLFLLGLLVGDAIGFFVGVLFVAGPLRPRPRQRPRLELVRDQPLDISRALRPRSSKP